MPGACSDLASGCRRWNAARCNPARAAGEVIALPGDLVEVQARTAGWVERLHVRQIGIAVEAGTVLAELYLPDVERVRAELALDADLAAGSAERLRRLGVAPRDLEALRDGQLAAC